MRITLNDDQAAFLSALDQMAGSPVTGWKNAPDWRRFDWSAEFDTALEQNGYFDCAIEETLGDVAAAAMTFRLARLPVLVESAASSLLRARLLPDLPRPLAVIEDGSDAASRFVPVARSALRLTSDGAYVATLDPGDTETVESLFAYPMGRIKPSVRWRGVNVGVPELRRAWGMAVAAELAGVLQAGLDSVVSHVTDRKQFGRPLGSLQAIQHRLAAVKVKVEAAYLLALKAAQTGSECDMLVALGYVQNASTTVVYDLHQFMGAMGLTLEHPLHRWTYRARLLRTSLGGAAAILPQISRSNWAA